MSLLQQLQLPLAGPTKKYIDVYNIVTQVAPAKQIFMIKAECGAGKTASTSRLQKTLYICSRKSLRDENKNNYTKVVCFNSLYTVELANYDYLIIDEYNLFRTTVTWRELNIREVLYCLRDAAYSGKKIIILSRDLRADLVTEVCELFKVNQSSVYYHAHPVPQNNRPVLITENKQELYEIINNNEGLTYVSYFDKRTCNYFGAQKNWRHISKVVHADNTDDCSRTVNKVISELEALDSGILHATQKLGPGTSLNSNKWSLNVVIVNNIKDFLCAHELVYQMARRVRNPGARIVIYFEEPKSGFWRPAIIKDEIERILQYYQAAKGLSDDVFKDIKDFIKNDLSKAFTAILGANRKLEIIYKMWCNIMQETYLANQNFINSCAEEFRKGGFLVTQSPYPVSNKFKATQYSSQQQALIDKWIEIQDELLKDLDIDLTDIFNLFESAVICSLETTNEIPEGLLNIFSYIDTRYKINQIKLAKAAKYRRAIYENDCESIINDCDPTELLNHYSDKVRLFIKIIHKHTNPLVLAIGGQQRIKATDLKSCELLAKFNSACKSDGDSLRFFTNFAREEFDYKVKTTKGVRSTLIIDSNDEFAKLELEMLYLATRTRVYSLEQWKEAISSKQIAKN